MPICSEFGVIDEYLKCCKDEMMSDGEQSEHSNSFDHMLPQFSSSFLSGSDQDIPSSASPLASFPAAMTSAPMGGGNTLLSSHPLPHHPSLPTNFLQLDNRAPYFPEHTPAKPRAIPLPLAGAQPPYHPPAQQQQPQQHHSTAMRVNRGITFVAENVGSGCTMIESFDHHQLLDFEESRDFIDLDKQQQQGARGPEFESSSPCSMPVKLERLDETADMSAMNMLNEGSGGGMPEDVKEDLSNYMFNSIKTEILDDCKTLSISPDPKSWSPADSQRWVSHVYHKKFYPSHIPQDVAANFSLPGEMLCQMALEQFLYISPHFGTDIHDQMQYWKIAMDIIPEQPKSQQQCGNRQNNHLRHNHHHNLTNSPINSINNDAGVCGNIAPAAVTDYNNSHNHHSHHPYTNQHHQNHYNNHHSLHHHHHSHHHNQQHQHQAHPHHTPLSISPAPSTDSSCSSTLSSSPGTIYPPTHSPTSIDCLPDDHLHTSARRKCPIGGGRGGERVGTAHFPQPHLPAPHRAGRSGKQTIHLWEFLRELLDEEDKFYGCIKWLDRGRGIFKIEDSSKVATLWGRRKNRPAMNYDKLSRSVRQYYKKGIIKKTEHSKRLVYQFCPGYL